MRERINVVHLVSGPEWYGIKGVVAGMARKMNAERFRLHVVYAARNPVERDRIILDELEGLGCVCEMIRSHNPFLDLLMVARIRDFIRQHGIDLVHSHGYKMDVLGLVAAKASGKPVIGTFHEPVGIILPVKSGFYRLLDFICLRFFDGVVTVSRSAAEYLAVKGIAGKKIRVIHPGIDLNEIKTAREQASVKKELMLPEDSVVVGVAGRLHYQKGHSAFIEAAAKLSLEFPGLRFLVVGEGELEGELEDMAKKLGLGDKITFAGYVNDVKRFMDAMDVFVLPSLWENLPASLLEAMALGKPVVATNVGGVSEAVVDGASGILVPPGDPEALAAAVSKLVSDKNLAREMGSSARRAIKEKFSLDSAVREYEEAYLDVLGYEKTR